MKMKDKDETAQHIAMDFAVKGLGTYFEIFANFFCLTNR